MKEIDFTKQCDDYRRIERSIQFVEDNFKNQPTLDQIEESAHLSKYHFNRLFKRWAGISPIQFLQFMTLEYTKKKLTESRSLLGVSFDAGLSGPGRLHDLFVTFEAMTPGQFKQMGAGLRIAYGFHDTPFGVCLLARTTRGICHLGFVDGDDRNAAFGVLQLNWPEAEFVEDKSVTDQVVRRIFSADPNREARPFHLLLKGTNFQVNVWRALLTIPRGRVLSYQDIAVYLGHPKAFRAVGNAIALNPVSYLIPCHRVIAKSGEIHRYRWGSARKKAILGWEAARAG